MYRFDTNLIRVEEVLINLLYKEHYKVVVPKLNHSHKYIIKMYNIASKLKALKIEMSKEVLVDLVHTILSIYDEL